MVHTYKRERHRAKGQHCGEPYRAFNPLEPYAEEACLSTESLAYPSEHTALLVGKHRCQLGGHERYRDKENQGRKQIVECRAHAVFGFGRQPSQRNHRHDIHNHKGKHTQLGRRLYSGRLRRRCAGRTHVRFSCHSVTVIGCLILYDNTVAVHDAKSERLHKCLDGGLSLY